MHPLRLGFPSYLVHHNMLSRVPVLPSRPSLVIYLIQSSEYVSISTSQFIPPPFSPLVSMDLLKVECSICSYQFNIWEHLQEMHLCLRSDISRASNRSKNNNSS